MREATDSHRRRVAARLDARHKEVLSSESEALYREIFAQLPASIWVEDWSAAKTMIDRLKRRRVKNWRRYFERRPELVASAADCISVIDVSEATLGIYRAKSKADIVIATLAEKMTADEFESFREQLIAFAEGATRFEIDTKEIASDGTEIVTRLRAVIPPTHRDTWSRVLSVIVDVTEQKKTEEALRKSEARLAEAQRIAKLGHWIWDEKADRQIYASETGKEIFGTPPGWLADTFDEWLAMIHPDDRGRVEAVMERARADRTGYDVEYRIVRADGETRFVHERAEAELDDAGELLRTIGTVQDITERKRAEQETHRLSKLAALGTIVAGMAHELAQPLNVISMASETALIAHEMARIIDKGEPYETFKTIHAHATRMGDIIRHLRDFGRSGPGDMEDLDVAVVVRDAVRLAGNQLELDGVNLIVDTPPTCRVIKGKRVELEQVLLNLFTNGRDAIVEQRNALPPGRDDFSGQIRIEVDDDPRNPDIHVRVSDNAGGIPEELLERIFDPFFTTKDSTKAMGLGLAICYRSIVNMGGRIRARNRKRGAQFELDLPVKTNE